MRPRVVLPPAQTSPGTAEPHGEAQAVHFFQSTVGGSPECWPDAGSICGYATRTLGL